MAVGGWHSGVEEALESQGKLHIVKFDKNIVCLAIIQCTLFSVLYIGGHISAIIQRLSSDNPVIGD